MPQYQGVWTLQAQAQAQSTQQWVTDPNFKNTTLLLQADSSSTTATQNNTFLDSANNFTITRNGNTTQGSFTPFSQASGWWSNNFPVNAWLQSTASGYTSVLDFSGDVTVEAWFYLPSALAANSAPNGAALCCTNNNSTGNGKAWGLIGTNQFFYLNKAGAAYRTITNSAAWPLNQWFHVAYTLTGNSVVVYLNGSSVGTDTDTTTYATAAASYIAVANSSNSTATAYNVGQYISNIRVSNTLRYTGTFTPSTTPFVSDANTKLLTCQSNRYIDNSSSAVPFTTSATVPSVQAFAPFAPQYQWTAPVIGGSGYFDGGTTTHIDFPSNAAFALGNIFTIEAWVYPTAASGTITTESAGTSGPQLGWQNSTSFGLAATGSGWRLTSSTVPTLNAWNHIVFVRSGTGTNQSSVFINGVRTVNGTVSDAFTTTGGWAVGATSDNTSPITGYVGGVRIVKGQAVYDPSLTTLTVPTAPLTTTSQGVTASNVSALVNFTNAGIYDGKMANVLETVGNAQVATSPVKYGSGSMYFNGSSDALSISTDAKINLQFGTGNFTIEFWAWKSANGSTNYDNVISVGSTGNYIGGFSVELSSTRGFCFVYDSAVQISSNFNPNDSTWHHYAVVRNGSTFALYKDGTQLTTATLTPTLGTTGNALVGAGVSSTQSNFNGYLDDLRVTKGIARYTANFIPPQVALPRQ